MIIAASISTAIATIADIPPHVLNTNSAIAQEKQPSSQLLRTLCGHNGIIGAIAISTNRQILVSGGDRTINLWDFPAGNIIASFTGRTGHI